MLCHGNTDFVGGRKHHGIEAIFHGKNFTHPCTDAGTVPGETVDGIVREGHSFFQRAVLDGQHGSHDLGDTGRVQRFIYILCVKNGAGIHVHDDGGFCIDLWPFWPAINLI